MRIACLSDIQLTSPRAHAINAVKTTGGFVRLGHEVLFLCAPLDLSGPAGSQAPIDPRALARALHDLGEPSLRVACSPIDRRHPGDPRRCLAFGAWAADRVRVFNADMVYTRDFAAASACADLGIPTIIESHAYVGDTNPLLQACIDATARTENPMTLCTISARLREHYVQRGAAPDRTHIVPDGVDLDLFSRPARLPPSPLSGHGPHVVYAGHLYDYKGIPDVLVAAGRLPETCFHLVGGLPEDIARTAEAIEAAGLRNVTLHGRVPHAAVPPYLWHADVLLLPPSAREASKDWTSPVKLGEYFASGAEVVCTSIPALRDWLDDEVTWCNPDDGEDLARTIARTLELASAERARRRHVRLRKAVGWSYPQRAAALLRCAGWASIAEASSQAA
ncbi:MAG: glycosyltransferase [Phycisphaeraceae bacterium]|nr:glycosyltransferase [Phycisphaeraceae bacterium]MCW5754451.1 glycosyltransferase [Phycisphaeraceae bacterium]